MSLAVDYVMEMLTQDAELEPKHWEELARRVAAKAADTEEGN